MIWIESNKNLINKLKHKYRLLETNKIKIDGFIIDCDECFSLSKEWILKRYKEFNQKYFNNELLDLTLDKIHIIYESYYRGQVVADIYKIHNNYVYDFKCLEISAYRNISEKDFCNTLLHEMVHIWAGLKERISFEEDHDDFFKKEIDKINLKGWNIPFDFVEPKMISEEGLKKIKNSWLVIYVGQDLNYKVFLASKEVLPSIKKSLKNSYAIKISNPLKYKDLTYVGENFLENIKQGIPMKSIKKEDLQKFLKDTEIIFYESGKRKRDIPQEIIEWGNSIEHAEVLDIEKVTFNGEECYKYRVAFR